MVKKLHDRMKNNTLKSKQFGRDMGLFTSS